MRPAYRHHVWSYDFVADRTHDGRPFRILNILDEYMRECLASVVARGIRSQDVLLILAELFLTRGIPTHIRSDNGPEFIASKLRQWLKCASGGRSISSQGLPGRMAIANRSTGR
jgi:putative transposase